ncbi:cytochrome b-c1 complex subunit 2, mitochondrial-like isoform X2 [Trichoplusia ni]|uniref:Cytochrome b-c1 complex subunit 2, mitochondrial-like isoform X2 n=1 Tax=Trichoplusia ni TaxID=7111 RepID=A0A7E5VGY5_TRINI|nr:cytochrome b-c1 complex subunit 2, mitochondrial-like isoform X2 [Trichoplusia ni]
MNKLYRIPIRKFSVHQCDWTRCWPKPDYGPVEVQRSVLLNGIKVAASKPLGAQIGCCTIMYQSGSRYECDDSLGATHFIRAASSASSCAYSGFHKMRFLPQHGASITCTSNRQSIAYTLLCQPSIYSEMKCYLLDTVLRCYFKQWEIDDLKPLIRDDLHRITPEMRVIDLAQKACWGGSLANSMFCENSRIDGMTGEVLDNFANFNYKTDHCTVASVGVPFEETLKMAEAIEPRREKPGPRVLVPSRPRRGFEFYDLGPDSETWICVVVPGCGSSDIKNLIMHAIVASACGTENIQDGLHCLDRTPQQPLGLMSGIVARTRACTAWKVAVAASEFLTNVGDLNFKQIDVGKKRLKVRLALNDDNCVTLTEGLALQLANGVQIDSAKNSIAMVDQMSNDEISCVAQGLSKKYKDMAYAVVGDITKVPHNKELICGF